MKELQHLADATNETRSTQDEETWLPPKKDWPERIYTLPAFRNYPEFLNSTEELLDRQVIAGRGPHPAIVTEGAILTYAQLLEAANRFGAALRRLGVVEGDRIMLRSLNEPPALIANFGALKLGAVVVPTSPLLSGDQLAHIANDCRAVVLMVSAHFLQAAIKAKQACPGLRHVVIFGGRADEPTAHGFLSYEELVAGEDGELDPVRRRRQAVSVLLYSSGITTPPRATAHFVEEALIIPDTYGRYGWQVQSDDVIAGTGPMSFAGGYSSIATIPYRFGATAAVIQLGRSTSDAIFELVRRYRITILTGMPTGYRQMLEVRHADSEALRTLRLITGGGEQLKASTFRAFKERFGHEIYEGFGTNGMMYVFITNAVHRRVKPGSMGTAMPGYEVKAVNDSGQLARPGELGQLYARGPVGTLYWGPPEDSERVRCDQKATVHDGWVRIGDWVTIDDEGYVTFVARAEDLITKDGLRFGPGRVEDALLEHPSVAEAGVIGVPDASGAQQVKAYVVLRDGWTGSAELEQAILGRCRHDLVEAELPSELAFVDTLPRTSYGTLVRRLLWEQWMADSKARLAAPA